MSNYDPVNSPKNEPPRFQAPDSSPYPSKPKRSLGAQLAIGCAIVLGIIIVLIALLIGACMVSNTRFGG